MKILQQQAEAWVWFTGDQPRAAGGFDPDVAKRLGKRFDFLEIGAGPRNDQTQVWTAIRGSLKRAAIRRGGIEEKIPILSARGIETDLSAEVQGSSDDAHVALEEIWKCLAGDDAEALTSIGRVYDRTVMVVEFPVDLDEVFPAAALMRKLVGQKLRERDGREPRDPQQRMAIEFMSDVGRRTIGQYVRFEPRVTSTSPRVLFTESPLRTQEHIEWLNAVADAVRSRSLS